MPDMYLFKTMLLHKEFPDAQPMEVAIVAKTSEEALEKARLYCGDRNFTVTIDKTPIMWVLV